MAKVKKKARTRKILGKPSSSTLPKKRDELAALADRLVSLAKLAEKTRRYARAARSSATQRAYRSDWHAFERWATARRARALPAPGELVALYLADLAGQGRKVATISRALSAIAVAHRLAGHSSPRETAIVRDVLAGIRRELGTAPDARAALLAPAMRRLVDGLPPTLLGRRDRALLLLGFAGGFRRSELVALDVDDLTFTLDGLEVLIKRSKTDQEGAGRKIGIPFGATAASCAVRAVRAWLDVTGLVSGRLFRSVTRHGRIGKTLSDRSVARVVKRSAKRVGLDPARLAGHSLRSGLATSAAKAGKQERAIMRQTGHRSVTQLRRYIQEAELFADNAAEGIL